MNTWQNEPIFISRTLGELCDSDRRVGFPINLHQWQDHHPYSRTTSTLKMMMKQY